MQKISWVIAMKLLDNPKGFSKINTEVEMEGERESLKLEMKLPVK